MQPTIIVYPHVPLLVSPEPFPQLAATAMNLGEEVLGYWDYYLSLNPLVKQIIDIGQDLSTKLFKSDKKLLEMNDRLEAEQNRTKKVERELKTTKDELNASRAENRAFKEQLDMANQRTAVIVVIGVCVIILLLVMLILQKREERQNVLQLFHPLAKLCSTNTGKTQRKLLKNN